MNHRVKNEKVLKMKNFLGKELKSKQTTFTSIPPRQIQTVGYDNTAIQKQKPNWNHRWTQARWDLKNHQASSNSAPLLVTWSLTDRLWTKPCYPTIGKKLFSYSILLKQVIKRSPSVQNSLGVLQLLAHTELLVYHTHKH